jgi:uncharacterized membrane protein
MGPHILRVAQIVLGSLLAVALLLVGLGLLLSRHWHVEASIMINAPPSAIHARVNDLHHWPQWAQWNQSALAPQNHVGTPSSGPGATLTWHGRAEASDKLTTGEVRIVRSDPSVGVWFESRTMGGAPSRASLTYSEKPGVTEVIWRDDGELPPIVGGLFRDLFQKRLAQHMQEGLEKLKDLVERGGNVTSTPPPPLP